MWSTVEIEQILDVFPEAIDSDYLIPRPIEVPFVQHRPRKRKRSTKHTDITESSNKRPSVVQAPTCSIIDPSWELLDPNPDIRALFTHFNTLYFDGTLDSVEVRWSPRMTLCAGLCCYEGRGGLCSIRLSVPLLKLRPRSDLVQTLLHEMIHAYLFVTDNDRDREAHGPKFQYHMKRINVEAGTRITIYHTFHDEVACYQTHWWRCNGACRSRPPFFGYVRRAMNRAPGPNDMWWSQHQSTCTGQFTKIKEPEKTKPTNKKVNHKQVASSSNKSEDIREFFKPASDSPEKSNKTISTSTVYPVQSASTSSHIWPDDNKGHVLGGVKSVRDTSKRSIDFEYDKSPTILVECPVCTCSVLQTEINQHLDKCI